MRGNLSRFYSSSFTTARHDVDGTDFKSAESLSSALDGCHIGLGVSPWREGTSQVFEVQTCWMAPGRSEWVLTGYWSSVMTECFEAVVAFVQEYSQEIKEQLGIGDEAAESHSWDLRRKGHDLHVHLLNRREGVAHTMYMAAMVVSLVSLFIEQRPRADTAVLGEVAFNGVLSAPEVYIMGLVSQCRRQGIRRLVTATDFDMPAAVQIEASHLEEDGQPALTIVYCENVLDALPSVFSSSQANVADSN